MMAANAIDHLANQVRSESNAVAFFFCSYKTTVDKDVTAILGALLRQLVQLRPSIPKYISELFKDKSKIGSKLSSEEVFDTLKMVFKEYSKTYVVIDALDECKDERGVRPQLLKKLHNLQSEVDVRLLITSRFTSEVEKEFGKVPMLEVRASKEDVKRFVAGQTLPNCITENEKLHHEVIESIVDASDGMFLLARLHVDSFLDTTNEDEVELALAKVSSESEGAKEPDQIYDQAYDDVIRRIESQMPNQIGLAKKALSWIKEAKRRLTVEELQTALAVKLNDRNLNQKRVPKIEIIVSVCAGLVTVDENSNSVQLVHYTTQDYFERLQPIWHPGAQEEIALACISYLSFDTFRSGMCDFETMKQRHKANVFFSYSAHYWSEHLRPVQDTTSNLPLAFFCNKNLAECAVQGDLSRGFDPEELRFPGQETGMHLAARYDLLGMMERLLKSEGGEGVFNINAQNSFGETPLSVAARNGHSEVVELLLEAGADMGSKDKGHNDSTPFSLAAAYGHTEVVKLLLKSKVGVKVDSMDAFNRAPLFLAAQRGHAGIVKLLLEADVNLDVNSKDIYGKTPLFEAAQRGHAGIVKLLLESSFDVKVDSTNYKCQTPLLLSAERGNTEVFKLLLEAKADIERRDLDGQKPLGLAAQNGHTEVVKLLLKTVVNVEGKNGNGQTPLSLAASRGNMEVLRLLLKAKANVDRRNWNGQTPLSFAAQKGHLATIEQLLEAKAKIESRDRWGRTPLSHAAQSGHLAPVKQLLEAKADIESSDRWGRTPLSYAAQSGNLMMVMQLLDAKADADSRNRWGWTPLSYASQNGNLASFNRLLEAKPTINLGDFWGRTLLSYAAQNGHWLIVKRLLEAGADTELKDEDGHTPHSLAAVAGHRNVVELFQDCKRNSIVP